ncbi:MAG: T9SS type A sorting domain-containing protein [Bacteroidota bacterium]
MRRIYFIIFLFSFNTGFAQYQIQSMLSDSAWVYVYGGTGHDFARQIISCSDSGYLVVGTTSSFGVQNTDMYVIKMNRNCDRIWSHNYGTAGIDWGYAGRETFDKGYIFCGYSNQNIANGYDVYLVKVDSIGNLQWAKTIGDTDWDFGYGIEISADSGFIIIGKTYSPSNGGSDVLIIKTDSAGNEIWKKNYGGISDETANTIYKTKNGDYMILGETNSFGEGNEDFYLLKINESGDTIWTRTYGTAAFDEGNSIDTTFNGNYFLFGTTEGNPARPGSKEFYIIQINPAGDEIYTEFNGGSGEEIGRYILQLPNGDHIYGGTTNSNGLGGTSLYMIGFTSSGVFLGGSYFGGTNDEEGYSVAAGKDGQIVLAGTTKSEPFGQEDVYLVRIDSVHQNYPLSMHYYNDSLVSVNEPMGSTGNEFTIYPNPFHSGTTFYTPRNANNRYFNCTIKVFDITGRTVLSIFPKQFPYSFENQDLLKEGAYIVSIYIDNIIFQSEKIIVY